MANIFLNLPVGNPGAAIDTSAMGADKSIVVGGSLGGGAVTVEISNDGGASFQPIWSFTAPGKKVIPVAAQFMRANGSASANADVGANDNGALFAILPLPAGDGPGAPVNVAALGNFTTFVVGGLFADASVAVEVSEDGVSYFTCAMFAGQGGEQSKIVVGNFMRTFVRGRSPLPFTATVGVGAEIDATPSIGLDELVKVSAADLVAGFLDTKLAAGAGIALAIANPGANESVVISAPGSTTDEKVKASAVDTTPGFLNQKLVAGDNISLTILNPGADEDVAISTLGAERSTLIFREGSVDTGPVVFGVWADLMAQLAVMRAESNNDGVYEILFDGSIVSPVVIPAAGSPHNLTRCKLRGIPWVTDLHLADGATFTGLRHFGDNLFVVSLSVAPSPVPCTDFAPGVFDGITIENSANVTVPVGNNPVWDTTSGGATAIAVRMYNDATFSTVNVAVNSPVIHVGAVGQFFNINAQSRSGILGNGISSVVGSTLFFNLDDTALLGVFPASLGASTITSFIGGPAGQVEPDPTLPAAVAPFNMSWNHLLNRFNVSGGGFTQILPTLPQDDGSRGDCRRVVIKEESGTAGLLVDAAGANTIEGSGAAVAVPAGGSITFMADGVSNWVIEDIHNPNAVVSSVPEKWTQQDVAANQVAVALNSLVSTSFDDIKAIRAGSIRGLSTRLTGAVTDATADSALVTVTVNGAAGTLSISHDAGTNPTGGEATQAQGIDTFVAGDLIGIEITTLASFAPAGSLDLEAWLDISYA